MTSLKINLLNVSQIGWIGKFDLQRFKKTSSEMWRNNSFESLIGFIYVQRTLWTMCGQSCTEDSMKIFVTDTCSNFAWICACGNFWQYDKRGDW